MQVNTKLLELVHHSELRDLAEKVLQALPADPERIKVLASECCYVSIEADKARSPSVERVFEEFGHFLHTVAEALEGTK